MNTLRTLSAALLGLLTLTGEGTASPSARPAQDEDQTRLCRAAIRTAERAHGIPQALLSALGRVESGRRDPASGNFGPWPWTINAEGRGQFFPTKAEAIAAVRQLQADGMRSIDVGCMQINLRHHPNAFASLEDAFDPAKNAAYAAQFLASLEEISKNWLQAAANYHSHTPEFGIAYQRRVMAAWPDEQRIANEEFRQAQLAAWAARPAAQPGGPGRVLPNGGMGRMQQASLGRGLDAYRAAPIPPAFARPALAPPALAPPALAPPALAPQRVTALRRTP
jgi:hypothetical protein